MNFAVKWVTLETVQWILLSLNEKYPWRNNIVSNTFYKQLLDIESVPFSNISCGRRGMMEWTLSGASRQETPQEETLVDSIR